MAQAPSPTTTVPLSNLAAPVLGAERVTVGVRQGWRLPDGSIQWDDGEKEVPPSGKSDAAKRAEAMRLALGESSGPVEPGAASAEIAEVRSEVARLSDGGSVNAVRRQKAKEVSGLRPEADRAAAQARMDSDVPTAEAQQAALRARVRALVDAEAARIEELKQLAMQSGIVLTRDGLPRPRGVQEIHDALIEALNSAERGDTARAAAALAELKRWSLTGDPDGQEQE